MQRILITAPEDDVLTLAEVKLHLGEESTDRDTLIQSLIDGEVAQLDAPSGGELGRAMRPQTWELRLNAFPTWHCHGGNAIELPFPPLIEIVSVKYDDTGGVEQTLTEGVDFTVEGVGGRAKQSIRPPYLGCWPLSRCYPGSVRIQFRAGFPVPAEGEPDTLPEGIKTYMKLRIGNLYADRGDGEPPAENPNLSRLLDLHKIY
jgi:uncharacterized phiE125 gp8 family phage protein